MTGLPSISFKSTRYLLAIVAGLLLAASFPGIGLAGLAWVAPGLMVAAALGKRGVECFRIGYIAGLSHYLTMLYWLLLIPYRWHGLPLGPAAGWLALSGFLALFPATWVWLINPGRPSDPSKLPQNYQDLSGSGAGEFGRAWVMHGVSNMLSTTWIGRMAWAITGAAVWVALEIVLTRIFGGFPWDLLGVSQNQLVPLIQIASVTGVYGVSFLIVWVSLSLLSGALMLIRRPTARSVWLGEIFLPVLAVAVLFSSGLRALRHETPVARTLRVALIQPSIPQTLIWSASGGAERFHDLMRLSESALTNQIDLMIWPEAAIPNMLRYDQETLHAVTNLAAQHHVWMIVGSDDAEPRRNPANPDDADYFNSSFLVGPDGELKDRYLKRNLVIFGEYVPLQRWLPFLKWFTPVQGGFAPGTLPARFQLKNLGITTAVLICFEDVFPQLARHDAGPDTDFLVNITNDGWFGESAAQWQHAATALFRSVENRIPLIRCSNNGLTCWIDAHGRVRDVLRDKQGGIHGEGFLTIDLPLPAQGTVRDPTFYQRHGDWFGWGCVGVACVIAVRRSWVSRRSSG